MKYSKILVILGLISMSVFAAATAADVQVET
jgi:hypothetical protein